MNPCLVISPLDCFWEGSKVLGPFLTKEETAYVIKKISSYYFKSILLKHDI